LKGYTPELSYPIFQPRVKTFNWEKQRGKDKKGDPTNINPE